MTLPDALDLFLTQLEADGRSVHTRRQYRRHVRLFTAWWRDVRRCGDVGAVSHEDVARFLASPVARTCADGREKKATAVNTLRSSLRGFFGYLHRAGYIAADPTRLVRPALCATPPPQVLAGDETERLLEILGRDDTDEGRRDHALVRLMLATGIRLGSAVALDVADVDLDRGELWLRRTKGDRPERVFLGRGIREHLGWYVEGRGPGPLFRGRDGERLTARHVHRRLAFWARKAGIRRAVSPHTLRHTFAQGLYERTGDILLVKEALRHRSITSTLVYARPDEGRLRGAMG